jgi:hypothetical protein
MYDAAQTPLRIGLSLPLKVRPKARSLVFNSDAFTKKGSLLYPYFNKPYITEMLKGRTPLAERLVTGDDVEQFLVNRTLTLSVKTAMEALEQIVDVLVRPLHGG